MTALSTIDYDLRQLEPEDDEIEVSEWDLISSVNPNKVYKILDKEPIEYFDYRLRYKVSANRDQSDPKYAYCVFFNCNSGSFQEDLLADFYYMQDLSKRFPTQLTAFDDICLEQTEEGLRAAFIHGSIQQQQTQTNTILKQLNSLIESQQLIPVLIKLLELLTQMQEVYFSEFEIENINLIVHQQKDQKYQVQIVNLLLPLHYRIEFLKDLCAIYEEEELELNETLILKKIVFLLVTLATEQGLEGYQQIRRYLDLWKKQTLKLSKRPIQYELLKLALNLVKKIELKEQISIAYVIDALIEIQERIMIQDKRTLKSAEKTSQPILQKRVSQLTQKSQKKANQSENESSHIQDYENLEEEEANEDEEEREDFICVPVNNMDHDTVHIKVMEEDPKTVKSQNIMMDTDSENVNNNGGYQSDVMRSLHRLVGNSGVTIRTNKFEDAEGGKNTVINVEQIRLQPSSSRMQNHESDFESRPEEDLVIISNQKDDMLSKPLKGGSQLLAALFKQPSSDQQNIQPERATVTFPNVFQKRDSVSYKKYGPTTSIKNAHSEKINCICALRNGTFVTGSNDKTLKVWNAFEQKPLAILEEDDEITHFLRIGKIQQNDIALLYVANQVIRILSLRQQKAVQLFRNDRRITAITQIEYNKNFVAFGTENGMIKDLDMKLKQINRRTKPHDGKQVTALASQGIYIVSASEDGLIVIYDYKHLQLKRELNLSQIGFLKPTSLYLFKGEEYLAVADEKSLSVINIESSQVVNPTIGNGNINNLVKLPLPNDNNLQSFVGCTSSGIVKIFTEGMGEFNKWIDTVKVMKGHFGSVNDICSLPNGALVSCGSDKSICFYEEKKSNANCACCTIF